MVAASNFADPREDQLYDLLVSVVGESRAHGQFKSLALELVRAVEASEGAHDRTVLHAVELLKEAQEAMNPIAGFSEEYQKEGASTAESAGRTAPRLDAVWNHKNIDSDFTQGEKYADRVVVSQEALSEAAFRYVHQSWATCSALERLMLDALVYAEVSGYGDKVRELGILPTNTKWALFRASYRWFYLAAVSGICGLGLADVYGGWAGVAGAVVIYHLMVLVAVLGEWPSMDDKVRVGKLLADMQSFYRNLYRDFQCPAALWEQVSSLASKGAVWDPAIPALVQHAMRRDPVAWRSWFPSIR